MIGATAPVSPVVGQLWWRTTDGNLYIYYDDSTSAQWVPAMASVGMLTAPPVSTPVSVISDTFESYTAGAQISAPWTSVSNSPVSNAQAHGGTKSLAVGAGGNGSSATLPLGTSLTKWILDVWLWVNATGDTTNQYIGLKTSAASGSAIVINIGASGAGLVGQWAGATWFTFTTTTGVWHHCVLTVFQDAVAGTATLTIDGTVVGTYSGDTRDNFTHTSVEQVIAVGTTIGPSPPAEFYVDDLVVYNNA